MARLRALAVIGLLLLGACAQPSSTVTAPTPSAWDSASWDASSWQ